MRELANVGKSNLVFGECNSLAGGVLKAAKSLGRTISFEVPEVNCLNLKGYLEQHVPIETPNYNRLTPNNDLFPAFISRAGLMDFVNS